MNLENLEDYRLYCRRQGGISASYAGRAKRYSFREVRAFPDYGELKNALAARVPLDLIIVDADLIETIAEMRLGDIGFNPFVRVIVFS